MLILFSVRSHHRPTASDIFEAMKTGKNKYRDGGYITVYVALSLGIILSLITTMLIAARNRTIRFQTECVADLGINSLLAEYNRELLQQYKLFFIDSAYGSGNGNPENVAKHLIHYMNINYDECSSGIFGKGKDLTACRADNALISGISYASDNKGRVLRYQIDRYMKAIYGLDMISDSINNEKDLEAYLSDYDAYCGERDSANGQVDEIMNELNSNLEEDEEPYSISNPADSVGTLTPGTALYYAVKDPAAMRFGRTDISGLISGRNIRDGEGLRPYQKAPDDLVSRQLFYKYIFDQCGYYSDEKDGSALTYQIEYLIVGKDSDMENMEEIADKIFKTRYAINMAYLMSSGSKQMEAEEMALAATSAIGLPELTEAVKWTILFAWGYAESAKDMRILYDGHGLTLIKTDASWNTPLAQMVAFAACLDDYTPPGGDMDYKKYLTLFLESADYDRTTMRLMDIMEMDIRLTPGNSNFRMDNAIYQFYATANISSAYNYDCSIKRFATYE